MKISVKHNYSNGLCCSCGVCKNVCSYSAITYEYIDGMYLPKVDNDLCINCGICGVVCPGYTQDYSNNGTLQSLKDAAVGKVISCYNAWSKNPYYRHVGASGGIITTLIDHLLSERKYDVAFCVDTYNYDNQVKTNPFFADNFNRDKYDSNSPKSRYVPISQENFIKYALENKASKIIVTAIPCALKGIVNVIDKFHLNRDNFLIIGLFCQKQFQYKIFDYFKTIRTDENKNLIKAHFKNKESGGWPGNIKFLFDDGTFEYKDSSFRTNAKDYFQPERCLYCIDKLAVDADISLGDNYTGISESKLGSNSVIIRTDIGEKAWKFVSKKIEATDIVIDDIIKSEALIDRLDNYYLSLIKQIELERKGAYCPTINSGIKPTQSIKNFEGVYTESIRKINIGKHFTFGSDDYNNDIKMQTIITKKKLKIAKIRKLLSRIKKKLSNKE